MGLATKVRSIGPTHGLWCKEGGRKEPLTKGWTGVKGMKGRNGSESEPTPGVKGREKDWEGSTQEYG